MSKWKSDVPMTKTARSGNESLQSFIYNAFRLYGIFTAKGTEKGNVQKGVSNPTNFDN